MSKRQIRICLGSSCFSRGNNTNLGANQEISEMKITWRQRSISAGHLCEELCSKGPIIRIDDKVYEEVNLSRLYKILQEEFPCN